MNQSFADYAQVIEGLSELAHPPILIGRMAMVCFGSDQLTHDIDLVAPDFPDVIDVLYRNGFRVISQKNVKVGGSTEYSVYDTVAQARYAVGLRNKRFLHSLNPESGAELDIILDPGVPYDVLLEDSREFDLGGLVLRVPSARNLIRLKELAMENDPSRRTKDQWDIDFLRDSRNE